MFCNCIKCHSRPHHHPNIRYGVRLSTALNHASEHGRFYPLEHFSYDFAPHRPGERNYNRDKYPSTESDDLSDDEDESLSSVVDDDHNTSSQGGCAHSGSGHCSDSCQHQNARSGSISSDSDISSDESSSDESSSSEEDSEDDSSSSSSSDESSDSESDSESDSDSDSTDSGDEDAAAQGIYYSTGCV